MLELRRLRTQGTEVAPWRETCKPTVPRWPVGDEFLLIQGRVKETWPRRENLMLVIGGGEPEASKALLDAAGPLPKPR